MRQYVVDCESLRERYNIEVDEAGPSAAPAAEQPAATIDCEAEVMRFWRDQEALAATAAASSPPAQQPGSSSAAGGMTAEEP